MRREIIINGKPCEYTYMKYRHGQQEEAMITIVNKRTYKGPGEYIGRPSSLGNPFPISKLASRDDVISMYRGWLKEMYGLNGNVRHELHRLAEIAEAGDLYLICWCAPEACHGDVIKEVLLSIIEHGEWRF